MENNGDGENDMPGSVRPTLRNPVVLIGSMTFQTNPGVSENFSS
jgi:hypothetical protein